MLRPAPRCLPAALCLAVLTSGASPPAPVYVALEWKKEPDESVTRIVQDGNNSFKMHLDLVDATLIVVLPKGNSRIQAIEKVLESFLPVRPLLNEIRQYTPVETKVDVHLVLSGHADGSRVWTWTIEKVNVSPAIMKDKGPEQTPVDVEQLTEDINFIAEKMVTQFKEEELERIKEFVKKLPNVTDTAKNLKGKDADSILKKLVVDFKHMRECSETLNIAMGFGADGTELEEGTLSIVEINTDVQKMTSTLFKNKNGEPYEANFADPANFQDMYIAWETPKWDWEKVEGCITHVE